MKQFSQVYVLLFLSALIGCNPSQPKNEETVPELNSERTEIKAYAIEVDATNPSWISAETLKERPSPPRSVLDTVPGLVVALHYSAPSVKNRVIWNDLVKYNEVWRTGANEATIIEFSNDVEIAGNIINAGKYALFTIPGEKEWTVILNSVYETWGAFDYEKNKSNDVAQFKVIPSHLSDKTELLTFELNHHSQEKIIATFKWEYTTFDFEINLPNKQP